VGLDFRSDLALCDSTVAEVIQKSKKTEKGNLSLVYLLMAGFSLNLAVSKRLNLR